MSSMVAPLLWLFSACGGGSPGPVPGDVVIAFQSRGEGEIEPCG